MYVGITSYKALSFVRNFVIRSQGSSVSIVTRSGVEYREIVAQFKAVSRDFSFLYSVQTGFVQKVPVSKAAEA